MVRKLVVNWLQFSGIETLAGGLNYKNIFCFLFCYTCKLQKSVKLINSCFHGVTQSETESVILGHFPLILIVLCHHVHNHNDSLIGPLHNTLTTFAKQNKNKNVGQSQD